MEFFWCSQRIDVNSYLLASDRLRKNNHTFFTSQIMDNSKLAIIINWTSPFLIFFIFILLQIEIALNSLDPDQMLHYPRLIWVYVPKWDTRLM